MAEITFPPGHGIPLVRLYDYLFVPAVQDAQDEHLAAKLKPDIDAAKKAASDARKARQGLEEAEANAKDYASHAKQAKEDAEEARDDINALVELLSGATVDPEAIATAVADYLAEHPVEGVTVEDVLAEIAAHEAAADPHPQYVTVGDLPDVSDVVREGDPRLTDARTPTAHGHAIADVTGLQTALDGKQPAGSYAASAHTHAPADITGTAVITTDPRLSDARTPTAHTHPASAISDSTATGRSVLTAADAAAARTAIGAGTSNLAIGTTGTTAAAGNRQATENAIGMVELATTAEATAGNDTTRAVTPAGLKAVADTKAATSHGHAAADVSGLAGVATSGAYADLTGQPDLSGYATTNALTAGLAGKAPLDHSHAVESLTAGSTDTSRVLAPDGAGGVGWVPAPSGGGGGSDPWVYSVVSVEATSDGTTDLANIPGMSIPAGLTAGVYQVKCMILSKASGGSQSYAFTSPDGGDLHIIAHTPVSAATVNHHCRVAKAITNPITSTNHMNAVHGAPSLGVDGTLVVPSLMASAVCLRYGVLTQEHTLTILPGSYLCYRRIA